MQATKYRNVAFRPVFFRIPPCHSPNCC